MENKASDVAKFTVFFPQRGAALGQLDNMTQARGTAHRRVCEIYSYSFRPNVPKLPDLTGRRGVGNDKAAAPRAPQNG
jgi:hypothetical protein